MLQVSDAHKKGVTCITAILISPSDAMFASTSSDGAVNVWELILPSSEEGKLSFSLSNPVKFLICLAFLLLLMLCSLWLL